MTPKNATAREKAIEALIAGSLRAPEKETEVTQEEIKRYVDQHVTLGSEEKPALEQSKPGVMQAIKSILLGNEQIQPPAARPSKAEGGEDIVRVSRRSAPEEFIEAIAIAHLTRLIATPEYPLGHLRQNKMLYLAHRKAASDVTSHYSKLPQGPYNPWATYKGPERIAQEKGYIKKVKTGVYSGFIVAENISKIDDYVSHYSVCKTLEWAVSKFRRRKNEQLELLTTVDFAALDLIQNGTVITVEAINKVISANPNWAPKLNREIFSDININRALAELRALFPTTYLQQ